MHFGKFHTQFKLQAKVAVVHNIFFYPSDLGQALHPMEPISQLIRFARASNYVSDFNTHNKLLTQKPLKQGYR